tara:strand:+ start:2729 stop:3316 length:588 start_codon:yes stop_codon:yes gene_type:complete
MNDVFNRLIKNEIAPNTYYVLHCIKNKIIPHKSINKSLEVKRLKEDGWLKDNLELTSKSIIFIEEITGFFKKSKKKTSKNLMGDNFIENIKSYVQIFPNKKLPSGKYARVNPKNLENSFRWFFENYNYDWNIIFKAALSYVKDYEVRNYDYMRTSQYFIRKQNPDKTWDSELANFCELVKNNPEVDVVYFKDKVD